MPQPPTSSQTPARIVVAVIGNPNTGKSTLFNALTGIRQKIGNYAGVTVERKHGLTSHSGLTIELIDLPGTYSLVARSIDEAIAVDVLSSSLATEDAVDAVLLLLDESNLERNLYLASQVLEFGLPTVIALTMGDVARRQGVHVETHSLAEQLGVPCIRVHAPSGTGLDRLREALAAPIRAPMPSVELAPGMRAAADELRKQLDAIMRARGQNTKRSFSFHEALRALIDKGTPGEERIVRELGDSSRETIEMARSSLALGDVTPRMSEAGARAMWARGIASRAVTLLSRGGESFTDKLDAVLTHKVFGTLIFLAIMAFVFQSIYTWSASLMDAIDGFFASLGESLGASIANPILASFVTDGLIGGIGGVLVFLPQIAVLFVALSALEASGYLSRAAYLMDRWLRKAGLNGRSFIPMMSGFACAVPAIMATRSIPDRASRITTMLVTPLTSCSARLPVYALLIGAFVPNTEVGFGMTMQGVTMLAMYCLGILIALPIALLFRRTLFKGATSPLMIELPVYRLPSLSAIVRAAAENCWKFVKNAGSLIFITSVVVWALVSFPRPESIRAEYSELRADAELRGATDDEMAAIDLQEQAALSEASILGVAGKAIEPAVEPLGWDWRVASAAIASFPAREVVVSTLGVLFSVGAEAADEGDAEYPTLRQALKEAKRSDGSKLFSLATALSLMVFFALCMQCAATLATIKRETNSWRWPVFTFTYMTVLAYIGAMLTYQVAVSFGAG